MIDKAGEMGHPPNELGGAKILRYAFLDESIQITGNCKHWVRGRLEGPASALVIGQYEAESGYYLFSCDSQWQTVTETWHETIEDALGQAEFEYEGITANWQDRDGEKRTI